MKNFLWVLWPLVAFVFGWSCYQTGFLKTEYSVDQFYPKEHGLLKNHDQIRHQFRLHEESPYLFALKIPEKNAWLNAERIKRLQKLSNKINDREDVSQVLSITHIEGATNTDDTMTIGNLFERVPKENWREAILTNYLLYPLLITADFKSTLIVVESKEKNKQVLESFEKELSEIIQDSFPEASVHTAGVPLLQTRLSNMIQSELGLFLLYTTIAFCGVFYLLFTHWSAVACALATLTLTNLFALALMAVFKIPMNAILVTLPVIVSVSIMSLLIHTLHLWAGKPKDDLTYSEKVSLAYATLKELFLPNALGILTTALGFLALAPSPIPLISEYGFSVAIILSIVALMAQILMFLFLPMVTPKMRTWLDQEAKWALWCVQHPKKILGSMFLTSVVGLLLLSQLNFSLRLFDDLPEGDKVRTNTEWIDKAFGGILTYDIEAFSHSEGFWKKPEVLSRLAKLAHELRKLEGVGTVVTVSDFFQGAIASSQAQISETLFLFSMAEKNPLLSFMSEDGKHLRIAIRVPDKESSELHDVKNRVRKSYMETFPEIEFKEGGMANYAHAINQEVAQALIFDFWQPLLFIGFFLIFVFRSFKWAVLACLPNIIPPAVLITALAVTQVSVKPGIALIFSIALGFAFNNTLYLLSRMRSLIARDEKDPLEKALLMEANPCLLESLIMFIGFSIFLYSEFNMNQTFGGFMLISILAGFAADLFFLPAVLKMFPSLYKKEEKVTFIPVTACLLLVWAGTAFADPDAKDILKKSQKLLDAKDDEASVEMKIIEKNGETKSRILTLKTIRQSGFSVLAKIQSPADIKNMGFLGNVDDEGNEKQWVYLPSSGQVRRLVTGKTKAGVLGSEISPEDLNSEAIKSSSVKMMKVDDKYYWIELIPSAGSSEYSRVVTKISKDDMLPKFTAYYVKEKIKKTVSFKDYKKIGPVYRAQVMNVQNHLNGRSTEVRLASIKVNNGFKIADFSQSQLKD